MRLAPGLHRVGNDIVAAYLVETAGGVTVIDAGLPGHWRECVAELTTMGRSLDDVRGVILTHGDSDHVGFAERLRRDHDVPVFIHEADADRARGAKPPPTARPSMRVGPTLGFFAYALRMGGARTRHLTEVVEIGDGQIGDGRIGNGQTLDLPGDPRVIALPGHSPGSIAIHVPAVDALFVGDALTTRHVLTGRRGPQPAPFTDDTEGARESLTRLDGLEATWVLPGHGAPWSSGVADLLRRLRSADAG